MVYLYSEHLVCVTYCYIAPKRREFTGKKVCKFPYKRFCFPVAQECAVSSAHPQNVERSKGDLVLWRKHKSSRNAIERAPRRHVTAVRGDRWRLRRFGSEPKTPFN